MGLNVFIGVASVRLFPKGQLERNAHQRQI